jgi:hypothetical protein
MCLEVSYKKKYEKMKKMKKVTEERSRIRIQSQRYGSADLDPDPYQNVTDPNTVCNYLFQKTTLCSFVANILC